MQNPKPSLNVTYLIEIRPHKLHPLGLLQQARPILLLQILLPQVKAHIGARGMCLGILHVDLAVEFQLDVVGGFLGLAAAGEGEAVGF